MTLTRMVDTDFGGGGTPREQAWFDNLVQLGYEGFSTTTHTFWGANPNRNYNANISFERALNAGLWIAAYSRPVHLWEEGVLAIDPVFREQLKFFVLDVEDEPGGPYPILREYVDGVESYGLRPVIYSNRWLWENVMGDRNAGGFADVPLHDHAEYGEGWPTSIDEPPLTQYGDGWNTPNNMRVGWQIRMLNPPQIDGQGVDDNVFTREFVFNEEPERVEEGLVAHTSDSGYNTEINLEIPNSAEEDDVILLHVTANGFDELVVDEGDWDLEYVEYPGSGTRHSVYSFHGSLEDHPGVDVTFDGEHWHSASLTVWRGYELFNVNGVSDGSTDNIFAPGLTIPSSHEALQVYSGYNWSDVGKFWVDESVHTVLNHTRGVIVGYEDAGRAPDDDHLNTESRQLVADGTGRMSAISVLLTRPVEDDKPDPETPEEPTTVRVDLPLGLQIRADLTRVDDEIVVSGLQIGLAS